MYLFVCQLEAVIIASKADNVYHFPIESFKNWMF